MEDTEIKQNLINERNKRLYEIRHCTNHKQAMLKYSSFTTYTELLNNVFNEEYNNYIPFKSDINISCYKHFKKNDINNFYNNIDINNKIILKVLSKISDSNYYPYSLSFDSMNINFNVFNILFEFLNTIDSDMCDIVHKMALNGKILNDIAFDNVYGKCYMNTSDNDPYITIDPRLYKLDMAKTLAHEIGHAFHAKRISSKMEFHSSYDMFAETPSKVFENMFMKFLKEKYLINELGTVLIDNINSDLRNAVRLDIFMQDYKLDKNRILNGELLFIENLNVKPFEGFEHIYSSIVQNKIINGSQISYLIGDLIGSELIDKYDYKQILEFLNEFISKMGYISYEKSLESTHILDNDLRGFNKKLIYTNNYKQKRYNLN